jgi:hypothetical protein
VRMLDNEKDHQFVRCSMVTAEAFNMGATLFANLPKVDTLTCNPL